MNTNSNPKNPESRGNFPRSATALMVIAAFAFIAIICILLALLVIYGWRLVYMI